ncbi:TPA: site-2 protease family protein, partial [Enterococcus faecium]
MKTILTFIIVFGILVIVHEFGHFFFAKRSGILVR